MTTFIRIFFLLIIATFTCNALADVTDPTSGDGGLIEVKLSGKISRADVEKFRKIDNFIDLLQNKYPKNSFHLVVQLDSTGGDLTSAINIGDILRENEAIAIIAQSWKCYSACVFVLAGATTRKVYGKVGIHRPYKVFDVSTSAKQQKKIQKEREILVKSYLDEMNVSIEIYNDMLRIPPEKNKLLSDAELVKYGLSANDPYWEDAQTAKHAKRLGITSEDYLRRKAKSNEICEQYNNNQEKLSDCMQKTLEYGEETYP